MIKSKLRFWLLEILVVVAFGATLLSVGYCSTSASRSIKQGNFFYRSKKFDEALKHYNEASLDMPDSDIVNFNIGAALYKKQDYQKAQDAFTKALASDNKNIEADALYNLGNCRYKLGKLKENTDLSTSIALLRESLDYYKRAIELDPKNNDARFNHEFVERELKTLLDRLKQQESGTDKDKQESQESRQSESPSQQEQMASSGEQQQIQIQPGSTQEESLQEKSQKESTKPEGQSQEEMESLPEGQDKQLTEEEALAILERYTEQEAIPNYNYKGTTGYESPVAKDW
ncbi:MAG: tetratricopeptide repeat protein [Candidatus Omnitrophica bacterium]|nr:tetratricopeptide repeat protein [Candidatus Omnitrophota bacterium]